MAHDPIYLSTAIEGALAAGRLHREYFRQNTHIHKKGRIDLVTAADLAVEQMFRDLVSTRFPSHGVLGEEAASGTQPTNTRHRWIIDPVDGTTNFAHGLAIFCVSIALEIDGVVEMGVVYDPIADELFTAERGEGARLNGLPIHVSPCAELVDACLCTGFPYSIRDERRRQVDVFAAFLAEAQAVRRLGSAALDLCYVAAGRLDGFWEERIHPWDIAAGGLMVQEAGGQVTGMGGEGYDPFAGHLTASNGTIHELMLQVVRGARHAEA